MFILFLASFLLAIFKFVGAWTAPNLHFYYDEDGKFTVNGFASAKTSQNYSSHSALSSSLPLRPLDCTDGSSQQGMDVGIKFCAFCSRNGAAGHKTRLLLCYRSQLGSSSLGARYRILADAGPEAQNISAKCLQAARQEQMRIRDHIKKKNKHWIVLFGDLNPNEMLEQNQWSGLEVNFDSIGKSFELRSSLINRSYKFAVSPTDIDNCFKLILKGGGGQQHPFVELLDSNKGRMSPDIDGILPESLKKAKLKVGQSMADLVEDNRGLWMLPWDFFPSQKQIVAGYAFQTIIKYQYKAPRNGCGMMATVEGKSVHGCALTKRQFLPTLLEDRGKWKLYSYNITYGQVLNGNNASATDEQCTVCTRKEIETKCAQCECSAETLERIDRLLYSTSGYARSYLRDLQFAEYMLLLPKTEPKEPLTRLGLGENAIEQFHLKCLGLEFALPIHN